jgi:hypothetical protein
MEDPIDEEQAWRELRAAVLRQQQRPNATNLQAVKLAERRLVVAMTGQLPTEEIAAA